VSDNAAQPPFFDHVELGGAAIVFKDERMPHKILKFLLKMPIYRGKDDLNRSLT